MNKEVSRKLRMLSRKDLHTLVLYEEIKNYKNLSHAELCDILAVKLAYRNATSYEKCARYTKKLTDGKLDSIRKKIYNSFKKFRHDVISMTTDDLQSFFKMYDDLCFDGDIQKYIRTHDYVLRFKLDGQHTFTTEGICGAEMCDYTITIPTEFFKRVKPGTNVAGHLCNDQLECLQRVIEHEMVHLIIFIFCENERVANEHGPLFMSTVHDLFRHTDHRHYMPL